MTNHWVLAHNRLPDNVGMYEVKLEGGLVTKIPFVRLLCKKKVWLWTGGNNVVSWKEEFNNE
jgi:hypothetical protein